MLSGDGIDKNKNGEPKYALATRIVHPSDSIFVDSCHHYNSSSIPIYQTATFKQISSTEFGKYDYTRSGNPTRSHLENHLAHLMGGNHGFAVSSGMSALDTICRLVKSGDQIIAGDDVYGGTNRLLSHLKDNCDISVHHVNVCNIACIKSVLSEQTRLVIIETPTNPLMKIADIQEISNLLSHYSPRPLLVVDNTMMSPYLQRPLELGADIVYHSGTKYLSGHHDLMAGVIGVKTEDLARRIYHVINTTGSALAPFECFLLMRGVKTLAIRLEKQQQNAIIIANFLKDFGFQVYFPGLKSHQGYQIHKNQSDGPGSVLSFETGSVERSEKIVDSTKLWTISVSFGCVNSLISMPCRMSHASIPKKIRESRKLPEDLIRLCVGIEDVSDLIEDLKQALDK